MSPSEGISPLDKLFAALTVIRPDQWAQYCDHTHELLSLSGRAAATPEKSAHFYLSNYHRMEAWTGQNYGYQRLADQLTGRPSLPATRADELRWKIHALEKELRNHLIEEARVGSLRITVPDGLKTVKLDNPERLIGAEIVSLMPLLLRLSGIEKPLPIQAIEVLSAAEGEDARPAPLDRPPPLPVLSPHLRGRGNKPKDDDAPQPAPAAASIDPALADWIFAQHSRRLTFNALCGEAARGAQLGDFRKADFLAAYKLVYETARGRPPVTGWPLRPLQGTAGKSLK
jgi:hypothetical protein